MMLINGYSRQEPLQNEPEIGGVQMAIPNVMAVKTAVMIAE